MNCLALGLTTLGRSLRAMGKVCKGFYAVKNGRRPGIYLTWAECESQVKGFSNAKYKKFSTRSEALSFIQGISNIINDKSDDKNEMKCQTANTSESKKRKLDEFLRPEEQDETKRAKKKSVCIYTDGACCSNGKNGARAGIGVYWGPNHPLNVSERLEGRQTNNRAEIHAAVRALNQAKENGYNDVIIYTDSNFLIKGVTQWVKTWKKNGWKLSTGEPVKNKEDFEALEIARKDLNVNWIHVRGHQGILGNEEADRLAVRALDK
ncbi:ribonuclease H1-like [Centruroides vittatus]|uniref:ribonuclease H1-like n=1 Tax=Centruroides vittatus TaxID=120091 RepID=UPI00350FC3E1